MTLVYKDGSRSWEKQVSLVARWRWQGLGSGSGSGSGSVVVVVVLWFMCLMVAVGSGAVTNNNNNNNSETASAVTSSSPSSSSSNVPHSGAEAVMVVHNPWISLAPFSNLSFNSDTRNKECLAPLDNGSWCWLLGQEDDDDDDDEEGVKDGDVATRTGGGGGGARDGGASSNAEQCLERHRPLRSVCAMVDDDDDGDDEEFGDGEEEKRRRLRRRKRKRRRSQVWANATLGFCNGPKLANVLGSGGLPKGRGQCHSVISKLQELDKLAQRIYCEFEEVLARYDCQQKYSIRWSCDDCKEEYKRWVCAMLIPYHMEDHQVKPCREFCHRVEQKCPYLLPDSKLQYAGEPSFLCIDDNIPETAKMSPCSAYGSAPNCYLPCHLGVVDVGVATNQCPELSSYYDIWVNGSSSSSNCTNTKTDTATATATGNAGMQMQMVAAGCSSSSSAPAARMNVEGDSSCSSGGGGGGGGIGALWPHCAKTLAIMAMCLAFFRTLVAHPFCLGLT